MRYNIPKYLKIDKELNDALSNIDNESEFLREVARDKLIDLGLIKKTKNKYDIMIK